MVISPLMTLMMDLKGLTRQYYGEGHEDSLDVEIFLSPEIKFTT